MPTFKPVCAVVLVALTACSTLRAFVGQQMAESSVVERPGYPGYPFPRVGYTYDSAPTARADHYGASEFVVLPTSTVEVLAVASIDDYCRAPQAAVSAALQALTSTLAPASADDNDSSAAPSSAVNPPPAV